MRSAPKALESCKQVRVDLHVAKARSYEGFEKIIRHSQATRFVCYCIGALGKAELDPLYTPSLLRGDLVKEMTILRDELGGLELHKAHVPSPFLLRVTNVIKSAPAAQVKKT